MMLLKVLTVISSRILIKELVQATGAPELLLSTQHHSGAPASSLASSVVPSLLSMLSACPAMPDASSTQILPLDDFLCQEVNGYKELLKMVQVKFFLIVSFVVFYILLIFSFSVTVYHVILVIMIIIMLTW